MKLWCFTQMPWVNPVIFLAKLMRNSKIFQMSLCYLCHSVSTLTSKSYWQEIILWHSVSFLSIGKLHCLYFTIAYTLPYWIVDLWCSEVIFYCKCTASTRPFKSHSRVQDHALNVHYFAFERHMAVGPLQISEIRKNGPSLILGLASTDDFAFTVLLTRLG